MDDIDLQDDDDDDGAEWVYGDPVDTGRHRTNLVGGFQSVSEQCGMPWEWTIAQRNMRQRQTFTRTFGT